MVERLAESTQCLLRRVRIGRRLLFASSWAHPTLLSLWCSEGDVRHWKGSPPDRMNPPGPGCFGLATLRRWRGLYRALGPCQGHAKQVVVCFSQVGGAEPLSPGRRPGTFPSVDSVVLQRMSGADLKLKDSWSSTFWALKKSTVD